jgi:hypothetical protein
VADRERHSDSSPVQVEGDAILRFPARFVL